MSRLKPPPRRALRPTTAASLRLSESRRSASTAEPSSISRRIHCSTALSPSSSLGFCETSWLLSARPCWERRSSRSIPALVTIAATSTGFREQVNPHGKGIAIDVSAILLADRRRIAVGHEASPQEALFMQTMRRAGCGWFTTILGPGEPDHADHFHFDILRHGATDNYRICE
jgi:hypothetical protein